MNFTFKRDFDPVPILGRLDFLTLTEKGNKIDNGTFRYSPPWAKKAFFETGAAVFKVTW